MCFIIRKCPFYNIIKRKCSHYLAKTLEKRKRVHEKGDSSKSTPRICETTSHTVKNEDANDECASSFNS